MLDRDLAKLYGVDTKQLKRQVRRNMERFPKDFMFQLSKDELENLRSQFGTSSWGGVRYFPMVFTEQGVAMLSSVLNSSTAIRVNIQIIRVYTKIRAAISDNWKVRLEIEGIKKEISQNQKNIKLIFNYLDELTKNQENTTQKPRQKIGYKK